MSTTPTALTVPQKVALNYLNLATKSLLRALTRHADDARRAASQVASNTCAGGFHNYGTAAAQINGLWERREALREAAELLGIPSEQINAACTPDAGEE